MNRTQHSISNTIWGTIYRLIHMFFPFLLRAFIIREIGIEYVGLNGLFKSIFSVLSLSELGLASAITYLMYKPAATGNVEEMRQLLSLLRKIYRIIGFVFLGAALAIIPFLHFLIKNDTGADVNYYILYLMYVFHAVVSYWLFAYESSIFNAFQEAGIIYKIYVAASLLQYITQIIVLLVFKNYYLYLAVFAISIIPTNLLYHFAAKKHHPDIYCEGEATREQKEQAKKKIGSLFGHRLGDTVIFSIDNVIISAFLGITILAKYDNYNYIMTAIITTLSVVQNSILASVGNKIVLSSSGEVYSLFNRLTYLWIGLIGLCSTCLLTLYQPFISLWVGNIYTFDMQVVLVFVLYFFVRLWRSIGVTFKSAAGLWESDKIKPYIGMLLNLALSVLFVKITNSIIGVMLPTMFVLIVVYLPWETKILFKELFKRSPKEYILLLIRFIVSALLGGALTYYVNSQLNLTGVLCILVRLMLSILIMPIVYFIINYSTQQSKESIVLAKQSLRRILKKR